MPAVRVPVHAQVQEVTSLLLGLVAQLTPTALPELRRLLLGLNDLPVALPILVRVLELMSKAKNKFEVGNWKRALLVAASDVAAVRFAEEWLRLVPLRLPTGRPKALSPADWKRLVELARDHTA